MNRIQMIFIIMLLPMVFSIHTYGQAMVFSTGMNATTYDYKNALGETNNNINGSLGKFYHIGYMAPLDSLGRFQYELGAVVNEYNAEGGTISDIYSWETKYWGINGGFGYSPVSTNDGFRVSLKLMLQVSSILNGEQRINGDTFDLTKETEFKGIFLQPMTGLDLSYPIADRLTLAMGYNYSKSTKISHKSEEVLNFSNHQWQLGLRINVGEKRSGNDPNRAPIENNPEIHLK